MENGSRAYPIAIIAIVLAIIAILFLFMSTLRSVGTVTQGTSATTAVTSNSKTGVITTFALTLAATAEATFTVNNSSVKADSVVLITVEYPTIVNITPTTGFLTATVRDVAAGSFKVSLRNSHASDVLNSAAKIHYRVL